MSDEPKPAGVQPWRTLSREKVYDCAIFTVERVRRESLASGKASDFSIIGSKDWVNVVALTPDEQVVLIRQYRHGVDEIVLEIPGGILDEGESHLEAARRELLEETGYECDRLVEIGKLRPNPAILDNWQFTVLALDARPTGSLALDEHEEIDIELHPLGEIEEMIRDGRIVHGLVLNAFYWLRLYREKGRERM